MSLSSHRTVGRGGLGVPTRLTAVLALLSSVWFISGANADAAQARAAQSCGSRGSATVLQTPSLRIYSKRGVKVACHKRSGRRTVFTDPVGICDGSCFTDRLRTAGVMVAYDLSYVGKRGGFYNLQVLNAKSGRVIRDIFQGETVTGPSPRREARLADVQVRANGSIVWVSQVRFYDAFERFVQTFEVRRADTAAGGSMNVVLDSSPDIDPNSLTLDGLAAHWVRGGEPVSAPVR